jgi:hypothetical protein
LEGIQEKERWEKREKGKREETILDWGIPERSFCHFFPFAPSFPFSPFSRWNHTETWAVGQAFQPDGPIVRLESLTYVSAGFHLVFGCPC